MTEPTGSDPVLDCLRKGTAPACDIRTVGQPRTAQRSGVCARCGGEIVPGQLIARTWGGPDYVHAGGPYYVTGAGS